MTAVREPLDEKRPQVTEGAGFEVEPGLPWKKIVLLAVVVGVLLAIVYLSPLREYLGRLKEISDRIKSLGLLAPLALTVSVAILVAVGFPRLLFCVIAGMALGFWSGLLWTQLGTLLGNYLVFLLARRGGRDWAQRYLSKRGSLHSFVHQEGMTGVILARQLPLPGLIVNLACALLPIRHRDYLLGTLVGQLPAAVPCTLIGAGALQASPARSAGVITLAVIAAVAAWIGLRWLLRQQRSKSCP
jgi:uncharacterized membrane protein YdjX (TVP38/TMEM64 family)